jgi:hypothetical protein
MPPGMFLEQDPRHGAGCSFERRLRELQVSGVFGPG